MATGEAAAETSEPIGRGNEVSCFGFRVFADALEARGIASAELARGLRAPLSVWRDDEARMDWADFRQGLANLAKFLSDQEIEVLGRHYLRTRRLWRFRVVAGLVYSPADLYRFLGATRGAASRIFRAIQPSVSEQGPDALRLSLRMASGYERSREFEIFVSGVLAVVPEVLGLRPAQVELSHEDEAANFDVKLERRGRAWGRLKAFLSWPVTVSRVVRELRYVNEVLRLRTADLESMQVELQDAADNYRSLMQQASEGIVIADGSLRALAVNRALCEMVGYAEHELVGNLFYDFIAPEHHDAARAQRDRLLAGESLVIEHDLRRRDGSRIPVELSARRRDDGCIQAFFRDISERRKSEEQRRRYQQMLEHEIAERVSELEEANRKLRALQQREVEAERIGAAQDLAASVAHVVNNPLAALLGTLEMHRESVPRPEPLIERSLSLARRIQQVVSETLRLHRRGPLELEPADPAQVLEQVRSEVEARIGSDPICLEAKAEASLPVIQADRSLLVAALVSVAENAVEAQPAGGWIGLEAGDVNGDVVRFTISDQGPGVPAGLRTRVFDPYFTTKGGGTGLGLAIARNIIRGHGGSIRVDAGSSRGSRFTIDVPTSPDRPGG